MEVLSCREVLPLPVQPQRSEVKHVDSGQAVRGGSMAAITGYSRGHAPLERDSGGVLGLSCPPLPRVQEHAQTVRGGPRGTVFPLGFLGSRWPVEVTVLKVGRRGPHLLREIARASPSPLNALVSMYSESLSSSLVLLCPCSGDQGPLRVYSPQGAHVGSPKGTPLTRVHSMMDLTPPCQSQHPLLPVLGQLASCLIPRHVPPGFAPPPTQAGPPAWWPALS